MGKFQGTLCVACVVLMIVIFFVWDNQTYLFYCAILLLPMSVILQAVSQWNEMEKRKSRPAERKVQRKELTNDS